LALFGQNKAAHAAVQAAELPVRSSPKSPAIPNVAMNDEISLPLEAPVATPTPLPKALRWTVRAVLAAAALLIISVLVWQGVTASGNPDPTTPNTSRAVAVLDIAVLVFREGLECILVLSAITASMVGSNQPYRRPIAAGAAVGFGAILVTWFVAVGILSDLTENVSALDLQAATGMLAVVVLLIVMNWFFHKVYWGGWISLHNRKKRELLQNAGDPGSSRTRLLGGLALLGFASVYREGFEVVLFLQSYCLRMGQRVVVEGALVGLFFTAIVAVLNFVAHHRLPYRKMLVLTGIMLGMVLLVMVGEQAQEMQLAHWIPTTTIAWLAPHVPDWMGLWFSVFPTVETLVAQALAAGFVIGSYFLARRHGRSEPRAAVA
jgi:high-affinity iron transporter